MIAGYFFCAGVLCAVIAFLFTRRTDTIVKKYRVDSDAHLRNDFCITISVLGMVICFLLAMFAWIILV